MGSVIACTVNPSVGRELAGWDSSEIDLLEPEARVVVVGAGPAGLEAAGSAARRGCRVVLLEEASEVGGALRYAARLPHRARWGELVSDLLAVVERSGVDVRLKTPGSAELVDSLEPDLVVVATGASWETTGFSIHRRQVAAIPRSTGARVLTPEQAIDGLIEKNQRAVIVDDLGSHLPLGVADLLLERGLAVDLVTSAPMFGVRTLMTAGTADYAYVLPRLVERGAGFHPLTFVERFDESAVQVSGVFGEQRGPLGADVSVLCMGRATRSDLYRELVAARPGHAVVRVGDCVAPREVDDAIYEGRRAARNIESALRAGLA